MVWAQSIQSTCQQVFQSFDSTDQISEGGPLATTNRTFMDAQTPGRVSWSPYEGEPHLHSFKYSVCCISLSDVAVWASRYSIRLIVSLYVLHSRRVGLYQKVGTWGGGLGYIWLLTFQFSFPGHSYHSTCLKIGWCCWRPDIVSYMRLS